MTNKKKIVLFCGTMQQGGAERVLSNLANHWAINQKSITLITIDSTRPFYELVPSIEHITLGLTDNSNRNLLKGIWGNYQRVKALRRLLKQINPDVLISFITDANLIAILASRWLKMQIIVSDRVNPYVEWTVNNLYKIYLKRWLYSFASYVVVQTRGANDYYTWLPKSKLKVINNPIQEGFKALPKVVRESIVLAVGRLEHQKNFSMLIEAFSKIDAKNWRLIIVGEGNEQYILEQLILEKNITNKVKLVGKAQDVTEWYQKASIFVLSSRFEGYPNVLIESMSMGLAAISTDCDFGPSEIIEHGKNGLLITSENVTEMINALQKLIEDSSLRNRLGNEAQKIREKLSLEQIAKQWELLF